MRKVSIFRGIQVALVVMVTIDCVCGDTLESLIRRRKRIKSTTQAPEVPEIPEETKEELVVKHQKEEPMRRQRPKFPMKRKILNKKTHMEVTESDIKYIPLVDENDSSMAGSDTVLTKEMTRTKLESKMKKAGTHARKGEKPKIIKVEEQVPQEVEEQLAPEVKVEDEPEEEINKERIVKEWMLFRSGVPVDYSYNETVMNPGDIVSSPGCPKSIDGYPWVLFHSPSSPEPKCYLVGQHSTVCQGSAVMNYQRDSNYGICACNFQECLIKRGLPLNPTSSLTDVSNGNHLRKRNGLPGKLRYRFCRPLGVTCEEFVYDQKEKRCDIMYSQGPCRANEWLQRNSKGGVECGQRLCEEGSGLSEKSELFQRNHGNVTDENAECCRPWGGFSVASVFTSFNKLTCDPGQLYSETLKKCLTPFKLSSLVVG